MTWLRRLSLATAVALAFLVLLGGLTRLTGSVGACDPGWPRCNASWLPPFAFGPVAAYLHGLIAALTLALAVITAAVVQRTSQASRQSRLVAWLAAGALAVERLMVQPTGPMALPEGMLAAAPAFSMAGLGLLVGLGWSLAGDAGVPHVLARGGRDRGAAPDPALVWLTRLGVVSLFAVIASGALTGNAAASLPCPSWPLCVDGALLPERPTTATWLHLGHRALAAVAALAVIGIAVRAWSRPTPTVVRRLSLAAAGLLIFQMLLGGNFVIGGEPAWLGLVHLLAAVAMWLAVVALAIVAPLPSGRAAGQRSVDVADAPLPARRFGSMPAVPAASGVLALSAAPVTFDPRLPNIRAWRAAASDYVALTKPGILTLLLVTTFAGMLIAAAGMPAFGLICVTIIGGALAAGGANVLNCYIDRDIDAQMTRTRHRATASNRVPLHYVLAFGLGLTAAAIVLLGFGANWAAALLALAGNLYYVLIYTKWLKRRTPQNIVIGGAAGAVPPLVGWAAVTGNLSIMAWMLFAIIFMWTPPHFWALALLKQGEYGRAAVPMLPVVAGEAETRRQIVIYSVLLFLVCLGLVPLGLGAIYLISAIVINAVFLGLALLLYWRPTKRHARRLFFWSLWYLALIFLAAVADRLIIA